MHLINTSNDLCGEFMLIDLSLSNTDSTGHTYVYKDLKLDLQEEVIDIDASIDINAVQNSITNMFTFTKGQRILLPDFGNNLRKFLYEPITDATAKAIGIEICDMFEKWEPRVKITKVRVTPSIDENLYHVIVLYTIPILETSASFETTLRSST